jgi:hypothetical protein
MFRVKIIIDPSSWRYWRIDRCILDTSYRAGPLILVVEH